jgi:hypothetical protein
MNRKLTPSQHEHLVLWFIRERGYTPDKAEDFIKEFPQFAIKIRNKGREKKQNKLL